MAHDVFISHSTKDKPVADAVCAMLEGRGIRCWIAPRDILPGQDWDTAIIGAIKASKVMVLLFSSNSNDSIQVHREVKAAFSKGVTVIPLRLDDVPLSEKLEYDMGSVHWLDAITPPIERHPFELTESIGILLGATARKRPPPPPGNTPMSSKAAQAAGSRPIGSPARASPVASGPILQARNNLDGKNLRTLGAALLSLIACAVLICIALSQGDNQKDPPPSGPSVMPGAPAKIPGATEVPDGPARIPSAANKMPRVGLPRAAGVMPNDHAGYIKRDTGCHSTRNAVALHEARRRD